METLTPSSVVFPVSAPRRPPPLPSSFASTPRSLGEFVEIVLEALLGLAPPAAKVPVGVVEHGGAGRVPRGLPIPPLRHAPSGGTRCLPRLQTSM
jgi:hypothetical protein